MLRRLWRYLMALFGAKLDELEDPEILLSQAQKEMTEMHARNRERAVQAITQKNNLQQMVDDQQKRVDNLQAKAELALKRGDRELALQLLKEKQQYEMSLNTTRESLQQAVETVEAVKTAIRREEEQIRQKTAQALALKAQWKQSQIQNAIHKSLDGIGNIEQTTAAFDTAQRKIQNAQSESAARAEMARERVENRIVALDEAEGMSAAEAELAQLETKLGLSSAPAQTTTTRTTSTDTDIERQLAELEAKVGGTGGTGGTTGGTPG